MHRIAILDNGSIEFLRKIKGKDISYEMFLKEYDYIIIPRWVWLEVSDSRLRMEFVDEMKGNGLPIYVLDEVNYLQIVEQELILLRLFDMLIRPYAVLKSYFRKEIIRGKDYMDVEYLYEEWIEKIYLEWPMSGHEIKSSEGTFRCIKKNAGELSIAFLISILNYSLGSAVEITVLSEDADCKNCLKVLKEKLKTEKSLNFELKYSFKTADCIYKELAQQNRILENQIDELIDAFRTEKTLVYTVKKIDNTTEICEKKICNDDFKIIIKDEKCNVIW